MESKDFHYIQIIAAITMIFIILLHVAYFDGYRDGFNRSEPKIYIDSVSY